MSLLSFFAQQRRQWFEQASNQPADYQAGGLAALTLAEADFRTLPLYNAQQQATDTQHEMEEVSYQLSRARQRIQHLEAKLAATEKQAADAPRWHQRRAYKARQTLRKIADAANHSAMRPDTKLQRIQELAAGFLANLREQEQAHDAGQAEADL
ncbi:MAG: hypothetical protein ACRYFX_29840 [Janthinobacterium lividum]